MKQFLLMMLFAMCITTSYAKDKGPKVDVNNDTVTVDGKNVFILEPMKAGLGIRNYFIKDLSGKKLAFLKYESYKDPKEISSGNPNGNVTYLQYTFLESKQTAETRYFLKQNNLAEFLIEQKLVQDGVITEEAEQEFILVNGNPYTLKRNELGGNSTIIINNTTPRNGVNFSIGR